MSHFNNRTNSKYNKKKKKITKSSILIIIIIFSIPNIISINPINQNSKFVNNEKNLEISDGEITIDTPENITYTEPMTGYYPGTYGFENDNIGEFPTNWEDITQDHTYCSVDVISEYKGHNNILQFYDGYSDPGWTSHAATCELDFTTTTRDTIEFWFLKASGTTSCEFQIREDDNIKIDFGVDPANNGQWQWRTSLEWIYLPEEYYQDDEWIHVRIDFDMVNDIANFTINNEIVLSDADIFNNTGNVNKIRMGTNTGWEGIVYLDAFSFSSDSNYNIGDNLNEGLLLSYTNTTQLDWKGYSLDGQTNRTILGNTTISLPNNGLHSIQVFGNDSSSNYYSSDLRYFTVDTGSINLITPENITYTEPMAGYYPGTYSFENDNIGEFPIKWEDITQNHTYCSVEVQKEYKGHSNILQFYDGYSDPSWTSHAATCELDFTTTTMDIIEFWFLKASGTTSCEFQIREDDNIKIDFGVDPANNGQWQWRTSTDWIYLPEEYYQDDEWIHVRIDFDMVNDTANFTINNEIVLNDVDIFNNTGNVNKIRMGTNTGWEGVVYLDAFSFSSDSNYNIGYNLNEGLLLSFTNTTQLDWMGYSLDGLANRTIMGNTTISLPNNGAHTIQVFGNKSLGEYIASNFVQFTIDIDLTPPEIIGINTILEIQQYSYCRINWTLLSPNGGTYQIFINDIFAGMSTFENSDVISITVDTHSSGQFNYTIIAIDSHENPAYHDVIIKVKEKDKPIIPGYDLLALFMISAISICIIGFIKKNKFKPNT